MWNTDLYFLGIKSTIGPFEDEDNESNMFLIEDNILGPSFSNTDTIVISNCSPLIHTINEFYQSNPNYSGGHYIFLKLTPDMDPQSFAYKFYIQSANSNTFKPKLEFHYGETIQYPTKLFYRVKYGEN